MIPVSFFIITKNEENNLEGCLESVSGIADEIIILDSDSTDKTLEIAHRYTDKIFNKPFTGYSEQKNHALSLCGNEWVFSIDADERLTGSGAVELKKILSKPTRKDGYYVPRKNIFIGKWMRGGGLYPDETIRFFNKNKGGFQERRVHEVVEIEGRKGHLKEPMIHLTCQSFSDFFIRQCRYAKLSAYEMRCSGRRFSVIDIILRPVYSFFKCYIIRIGIRDGWRGWIYAVIFGYYTFLKYAYLWEFDIR